MVEQVAYDVVRTIGKIEIRRYPRLVIARVDGYGDDGFGILFRYISGANRQKAKVAMTAPVISERIAMTAPVLSDASALAFVLPERYRLDTTPEPLDDRVHLREVPGRFVAALRFSGRWSEESYRRRAQELTDALAEAAVTTKGGVFVMRYSGPYTPWFLRRNEVALEVEWDDDRDAAPLSGGPATKRDDERAVRSVRAAIHAALRSYLPAPYLYVGGYEWRPPVRAC